MWQSDLPRPTGTTRRAWRYPGRWGRPGYGRVARPPEDRRWRKGETAEAKRLLQESLVIGRRRGDRPSESTSPREPRAHDAGGRRFRGRAGLLGREPRDGSGARRPAGDHRIARLLGELARESRDLDRRRRSTATASPASVSFRSVKRRWLWRAWQVSPGRERGTRVRRALRSGRSTSARDRPAGAAQCRARLSPRSRRRPRGSRRKRARAAPERRT